MLKRALITGWGLYLLGVALLLGFPEHLVRRWTVLVLLALSLALIAASVVWALAAARRQAVKRRQDILRIATAEPQPRDRRLRPTIERSLAVGWALFIMSALAALLFPQSRWSPGPESLLVLCAAVVLSSITYAAYSILQQLVKRLRREKPGG
jgi:drug/metabolite transporter (DMT)-like permease